MDATSFVSQILQSCGQLKSAVGACGDEIGTLGDSAIGQGRLGGQKRALVTGARPFPYEETYWDLVLHPEVDSRYDPVPTSLCESVNA